MGEYINLSNMTKERFLIDNGRRINLPSEALDGELPVCLVNNGPFTAAAIAYDEREVTEFMRPDDERAKLWFAVPRGALMPFMSPFALRAIGEG